MTCQISELEIADEEDEPAQEAEEEEDELDPSMSLNCEVTITKSGETGALAVDISATEDGFQVFNVAVFDKTVAEKQGAEASFVRKSRYMGPGTSLRSLERDARLLTRHRVEFDRRERPGCHDRLRRGARLRRLPL